MTDANALARRWLAALPSDPSIHLHRIDIKERTAVLCQLDEARIRAASFLDDRAFDGDTLAVVVPIEAAIEAIGAVQARPHDAIFHLARCGSTLVSRLIGELPNNLPKREPLPWLACAMHARKLNDELTPRAFAALFEATSRSLARPFTPKDRVIVKSTSIGTSLLPHLMLREPSQRAVALTLPLERWLATLLDDDSSLDNVAHYAPWWKGDLVARFPESGIQEHLFSTGELLAMAWCGPMAWFDNAREHHPERIKVCDVDKLLEHPAVGLAALASFLKLDASAQQIAEVAEGGLLDRYSKDPDEPFDRAARAAQVAQARERHAEEIAKGLRFAERFASVGLIAENLS